MQATVEGVLRYINDPVDRELVAGYMDGHSSTLIQPPGDDGGRTALYWHGWRNGRDDRMGQPSDSADVKRSQLETAKRLFHEEQRKREKGKSPWADS